MLNPSIRQRDSVLALHCQEGGGRDWAKNTLFILPKSINRGVPLPSLD